MSFLSSNSANNMEQGQSTQSHPPAGGSSRSAVRILRDILSTSMPAVMSVSLRPVLERIENLESKFDTLTHLESFLPCLW